MKVTVIGVAGGTGSGKSTLVKRLQEAFEGDDVVTLCHDYYYKAHPELTYEERTKLNYDHPQAFDTQMLVDHIKALKNNVPIEHPVYSFVEHNRLPETVSVKPSKVIIVDGILIFENKELRDLMDIKVYVDTDADIRLARRILRDVCERGRTMQSVITQYTTTVKPMHEEFVEPSKKYADVIIPEGGFNSVAVAMLIQRIQSLIEESRKYPAIRVRQAGLTADRRRRIGRRSGGRQDGPLTGGAGPDTGHKWKRRYEYGFVPPFAYAFRRQRHRSDEPGHGPKHGPNLQNRRIRVSLPPESSDTAPPGSESKSGPARGVRQ